MWNFWEKRDEAGDDVSIDETFLPPGACKKCQEVHLETEPCELDEETRPEDVL